jgi:signal transduction histidine kinase
MARDVDARVVANPGPPPARPEPLDITGFRDDPREPRRLGGPGWYGFPAALVAMSGAVVAATLSSTASAGPGRVLSGALVIIWGGCAVLVASRRPDEPLGLVMVIGALAGMLALLGAVLLGRSLGSVAARDAAAASRAIGLAILPAALLHLAMGLPDGRLRSLPRRVIVAAGYVAAVIIGGFVFTKRPALPSLGLLVFSVACAVVAVAGFVARCRTATLFERPRLQWTAWAVTVAVAIGSGAGVLNLLINWPAPIQAIAVGATILVPVSLAIGASREISVRIDRLLIHTITLAGLFGLVGVSYVVVVLGLGPSPSGSERSLLGLSMLAAAVAALLWVPTRERLADVATRRVYGERHAPDEVLRTFGSRLTRALPLDELLLQLAESLKKTMLLESAEVWTRSSSGRLERAVSVPERGAAAIELGAEEEIVVARAGVSGPAWIRVWLPALLPVEREEPVLRVAPVTNSGELLGLIVVTRPEGAVAFDDSDDQALTELARQVGLALHNVKLDSALQASLDEVRRQADELRVSRARIVQAGDAQRRSIERDLHDGAQQRLVALAVSVRLAEQLAETDTAQARAMLEEIGTDLQEAVQELRNLAHGIYPPLLAERGLPEALSAAAGRAPLPTSVDADGLGRYSQPTEAAVYFCVLEALQNAGKHAGDGAEITVTVHEDEGALLFDVADDGAGFDLTTGAGGGHGFVNMADRVGAIGGTVTVDSAPGHGTRISGRIPVPG